MARPATSARAQTRRAARDRVRRTIEKAREIRKEGHTYRRRVRSKEPQLQELVFGRRPQRALDGLLRQELALEFNKQRRSAEHASAESTGRSSGRSACEMQGAAQRCVQRPCGGAGAHRASHSQPQCARATDGGL